MVLLPFYIMSASKCNLEHRDEANVVGRKRTYDDRQLEDFDATEEETESEAHEENELRLSPLVDGGDENTADDHEEEDSETDDSLVEQIEEGSQEIEALWNILLTELWKDDETSCENALMQLVAILDSGHDFAEQLACFNQLGGQFAVHGVLNRWPSNPTIQASGCNVFAVLTNDESFIHDPKTLQVACGLEVILQAMRLYPTRSNLQISGCCVLSRCCIIKENAAYAVGSNCIELITGAMMNFPEDAQVQRWGCWALCTLSRWRKCRLMVVEAGGFGLLAFAIGREGADNEEKGGEESLYKAAARTTLRRLMKQKEGEGDEAKK